MKWPFVPDEIVIERSKMSDASDLADIHQSAFSRGWTEDEFIRLIESDNVIALQCRRPTTLLKGSSREPKGFVLVRVAADEAEILTIAVSDDARGLGIGKALLSAVMKELYFERVHSLFLEVDETNASAVALYRSLKFQEVGERQSYYEPTHNHGEAGTVAAVRPRALVMRRDLR